MRIQKLEIVGFKSFVDRTVLRFDHEVTAIVGPNGCGKSNVVDAIKWAMGEQSAQRLRGKSMDDVIFNGSESRGPHGFAEVTITFANEDGLAPAEYADYPEISVTRRLDRQGNSDYLINRTPVRLLDITNLFLGTGVGKRAYSIIEQGRIGFIVSSKPADRRVMIEEAAGITKFKARKRAAERKIDQTRSNLLRIGDIVLELERSLASLNRQAKKAERYRVYRNEARDLELYIASHRYLELFTTAKVVSAELTKIRGEADDAKLELRSREVEAEAARVDLEQRESDVERAQNRAFELDNRVKVIEGEIQQRLERIEGLKNKALLAEREIKAIAVQKASLTQERDTLVTRLQANEAMERDASSELDAAQAEFEQCRSVAAEAEEHMNQARAREAEAEVRISRAEAVEASFERRREEIVSRGKSLQSEREAEMKRHADLEQEAREVVARLTGLRGGQQQTAARQNELEAELQGYRAEIAESDKTVSSLREQLTDKRSRLNSLNEIHERYEGVGAGVRAVMDEFAPGTERGQSVGLHGLVIDRIDCGEEYTVALAAALGERLQSVVVESTEGGLPVLDFLREKGLGRVTLLPRRIRRVSGSLRPLPMDEGILGRLSAKVAVASEDREWAHHLLSSYVLVSDLAAGLRLRHQLADDYTLVTLAGEILEADGAITGGAAEDVGAHLIGLKREMRELREIVTAAEQRLTDAESRHGELRTAIVERQAAIEGARSEAHGADIAIVTAEKDQRRLESDQAKALQRAEALVQEASAIEKKLQELGFEERAAGEESEAARKSRQEASTALNATQEVYHQRRAAVEAQGAKVTEMRVSAAQARERAESDRVAMRRLDQSLGEFGENEARLLKDVSEGAEQQAEISNALVEAREGLESTVSEAMAAQESLGELRAAYEEARAAMGEFETSLRTIRASIDDQTSQVNALALQDRELDMDLRRLLELVDERHDLDLRHALIDYHHREVPDTSVQARVDELQRLISRMGTINLLAIEEYEEKSTRYEYLKGQQVDLQDALGQLERAIRKMNRESRKMFKEAFEAVNLRFKKVFPQLFAGGKAELKLSNPEDLLETGIEIIAQPPGKRLGSLELMSGGEKALTAVAMILAIFQYKPSPFCLLDEVDAPLDEANVGRYADAIRQMTDRSQFIVITHSKRTMEFADMLYGVTMAEPGISNLVSVELRQSEAKRKSPAEDEQAAVA